MSARRAEPIRNIIRVTTRSWPGEAARAPWLGRYQGPTHHRLEWIAERLRASPKKAERRELAAALDELARVLGLEQRPAKRPGPKMTEQTWRRLGVVIALVNRCSFTRAEACRAACANDRRAADRLRKTLATYEAGGIARFAPPGADERELSRALERARRPARKLKR